MALIYCRECGKQISDQAAACPHCGCPLGDSKVASFDPNRSKYDWLTTLLLCFFLGEFGIHSFYSGKKWGFAQNYDLCIDSSKMSIDQAVNLIVEYLKIKNQ